MIGEYGIKLIDFGSLTSNVFKHKTTKPAGALDYAAPEYYTNQPIGVASDLFAFAVIVYEMLTGVLPFEHQYLARAQRYLYFKPPHKIQPDLPVNLVNVFERAFCVNPFNRYQSLSEFIADLEASQSETTECKPWIEADPVRFWQTMTGLAFLTALALGFGLGQVF